MLLSYDQEKKLVKTMFAAYGMPENEAEITADVVTHSDFTGVYSHGISRLTVYLMQLASKAMNPRPNIVKTRENETSVSYDCDNGHGIVAVNMAYDEILPKARKYGIAIATGRHSANIGCGHYYGARAARDGVIIMLCCNTYRFMAPFGGSEKLLGTNPIIVGVPTGSEPPLILDMSTSLVAMGKVQDAMRERRPVPAEWGLDRDGKPTTEANKIYTLRPVGGYKGYGLAVMVDMFAGALAGASLQNEIGDVYKMQPEDTGFSLIMIDPSVFMPIEEFTARTDEYCRVMKSSKKAEGAEEIFMPGEIECRKYQSFMASGFELTAAQGREMVGLAARVGLCQTGEPFDEFMERVLKN